MIEYKNLENLRLAIIIRNEYYKDGIEFFTNEQDSQQLGYMSRQKDYSILPHCHNIVPREVHLTQEVLYIKKGKVRVDFYDNEKKYAFSSILYKGDVILLADGGHGFKMIEDSEIIEIKQGPYCGEEDKVRFTSILEDQIIIQ
jgi:mannose-6-phosphate isomerase-like protein (cupin superfamily)